MIADGRGLRDLIIHYLREQPNLPIRHIAFLLGEDTKRVHNHLRLLVRTGRVVRDGWGRYRLAPTDGLDDCFLTQLMSVSGAREGR